MKISRESFARVPKKLVLSYALDWIVLLVAILFGGGIALTSPNKHPFSLADPKISYPFVHHEKVPDLLLFALTVVGVALIILVICLIFVPGPTVDGRTPRSLVWRLKAWELNAGWLGLILAHTAAWVITNGSKNMFGKPRPDLLSRCDPDLANIKQHIIGGFGDSVPGGEYLVSHTICKDRTKLDDGFRSFPSGHSSSSWAGFFYLTLFLCSKFAIVIPFLAPRLLGQGSVTGPFRRLSGVASDGINAGHQRLPSEHLSFSQDSRYALVPIRKHAAAPPNYLLILAFIPIGAAIYISSTRYSDYRHHGFDILSGALIGIFSAWFAFRWYHLPVRQGAGWAWGARSPERAFGVGLGVGSYVSEEDRPSQVSAPYVAGADVELGQMGAPEGSIAGRRDYGHVDARDPTAYPSQLPSLSAGRPYGQ